MFVLETGFNNSTDIPSFKLCTPADTTISPPANPSETINSPVFNNLLNWITRLVTL